MTSDRLVAWLRISAVSSISTANVDLPSMMRSAAPIRVMMRSIGVRRADWTGTLQPTCARIARLHALRRSVDLPPAEKNREKKRKQKQMRPNADCGACLRADNLSLLGSAGADPCWGLESEVVK